MPLTNGKDGTDRIVVTAGTYTAKYRDGSGVVQEKVTGCHDKEATGWVLADMEHRAELVKAKVITVAEDSIADHQGTALDIHISAFIDHQKAKGVSRRINDSLSQLRERPKPR